MKELKLSHTTRGQAWLSNFSLNEQHTAQLLVDAVRLVPLDAVRRQLRLRLQQLIETNEIELPAMLVAALSIEDIKGRKKSDPPPVAFKTFQLGDPISPMPGSEGFIGNLIRDVVDQSDIGEKNLLSPLSSLTDLRDRRCRSIIIISDYGGSGNQLIQYAKTIVRNPTIRSWRSAKAMKIHTLTFASTEHAIKTILSTNGPVDMSWHEEVAPSIASAPWTSEQRQEVELLCKKYALKKVKNQALGYRASGGLFATSVSVPNNIPVVLRQTAPDWQHLFYNRTVPLDLAQEMQDYKFVPYFKDIAQRAGQPRLSQTISNHRRAENTQMLLVLALLNHGIKEANSLSAELACTVSRVETLLASLKSLGLINEMQMLTPLGRIELVRSKRARRRVTAGLEGSEANYYPVGMR